ncbi:hypothetical protein [Alicyclobacillus ferrooxydans]|nr:hypothetical protein [Alicyclobacillus ferrooxydans]
MEDNGTHEDSVFDIGAFENELEDEDDDDFAAHRIRKVNSHRVWIRR